jgi:hypothetical protein
MRHVQVQYAETASDRRLLATAMQLLQKLSPFLQAYVALARALFAQFGYFHKAVRFA